MQRTRVEVRKAITGGTPDLQRAPFGGRKKRVSIFDEQSHYVIENKGSEKRTKPNEAVFICAAIEQGAAVFWKEIERDPERLALINTRAERLFKDKAQLPDELPGAGSRQPSSDLHNVRATCFRAPKGQHIPAQAYGLGQEAKPIADRKP